MMQSFLHCYCTMHSIHTPTQLWYAGLIKPRRRSRSWISLLILYIHTLRTAAAMGDCPRGTPHYSRWGSLPGNSHNMYCELVLFPFNTALCNYIAIIYLLCGREQSLGYPPNKVGQLDNAGDLRIPFDCIVGSKHWRSIAMHVYFIDTYFLV